VSISTSTATQMPSAAAIGKVNKYDSYWDSQVIGNVATFHTKYIVQIIVAVLLKSICVTIMGQFDEVKQW